MYNYGKKASNRSHAKKHIKTTRVLKQIQLILMRLCVLGVIVVIALGGAEVYKFVMNLINDTPDAATIDISPTGYLSIVLDKDGNEIETLVASGANRVYVTLDEIPDTLEHAFVAIEDERFYTHNGIDTKGIVRAFVTGVSNNFDFSQGASTITQQLLKNNVFTTWTQEETFSDKLERKIQEQYLAVQLEKFTSKDEILENYLNTINLGQNCLGVEAAAQRYFNKEVKDLTLSECAVIAGITKNPSAYNPISRPDKNKDRRNQVLANMLEQGYISQSEYDQAMADDVYNRIASVNTEVEDTKSATSYFVDKLTADLLKDLQEKKGLSEAEAYQMLYAGGLTIWSTQDSHIQEIADTEVNNQDNYDNPVKYSFLYRLTIEHSDGSFSNYSDQTMLSYYKSSDKNYNINFDSVEECTEAIEAYKAEMMGPGDKVATAGELITITVQPQVALTIMDQSTGYVVAMVGGRGEKSGSKTLNRAVDTLRQPGSTFKVLAAYAPALDAGGKTLASVQDNAPMLYNEDQEEAGVDDKYDNSVDNYDAKYTGFTSYREGIIKSINVVAVKTMQEVGVGLCFEYLQKFGFTSLVAGDANLATALGGVTHGVSNIELTAAYASIANHGTYCEPKLYTKVTDSAGNVILDNLVPETKEVLKESTAWLLTSAMQDVMTKGTGGRANFSGMAVAGKTGTTTKNRDTVFAGFTPYYTCVIWGGYDDNMPQSNTNYSKNIWRQVMSKIHDGLEYRDFTMPSDIVQSPICTKSGLLPNDQICPADPRGTLSTEYFAEGTQPETICDKHVAVTVCAESHYLATGGCPAVGGLFIVGAAEGSDDSAYGLPEGYATIPCPFHSGISPEEFQALLDANNIKNKNVTNYSIETPYIAVPQNLQNGIIDPDTGQYQNHDIPVGE